MNKSIINKAITAALCLGALTVSASSSAAINNYDWDGVFTMLDGAGAALANTSIPAKGNNQFQTPVSGTMAFDTTTGAGTATLVPFEFFSGTLPAEATSIEMQAIGDGVGGPGTLVLGNMLFNWNGNNGIPVSIVLDAAGFFAGDLNGGGAGATPASDGTYAGTYPSYYGPGYLGLGPIPIATTAYNTTNSSACDLACTGVLPSGLLPLVTDTATNGSDFIANTGGTIGGSPMQAGPFAGTSANFDFTSMTLTSTTEGTIGPFDVGPAPVPVPAAVWLFGSGLLGLIGVARRKES